MYRDGFKKNANLGAPYFYIKYLKETKPYQYDIQFSIGKRVSQPDLKAKKKVVLISWESLPELFNKFNREMKAENILALLKIEKEYISKDIYDTLSVFAYGSGSFKLVEYDEEDHILDILKRICIYAGMAFDAGAYARH